MLYRPQITVPLLITAISVDLLTSIFALGFYHQGLFFDSQNLAKNLLLQDGYNWFSSPIDFVVIALIRSSILFTGLILYLQNKIIVCHENILMFANYVTWTYGLVKFLGMADHSELHLTIGSYYSVVWNITAAIITSCIWVYGLHSHKLPQFLENVVASIEKICPILVRPISRHHESELLINEEDEEEIKMSSYETGKKLINYCRHYSYWFAGSFTCSVIFAGTLVSVPFFTGKLIAELVNGGGVEVIIKSVCFVGGLSLVSSFFGGLVWGSAEWASALIHQKMRMDLLKSLIYQDAAFYDELQTGEITSRLSSDVEKMASLMATNFNVSLRVSLMLSGSFIYMFLLSWRLCIVCFIMIPLYAIVTSRFGNMFDKVGEKDQDTMANSNKKAEEILSAMKTVKSFASEGRELGKYEQLLKKNLVVKRTKAYLEISYGWFAELCENTILVLVLAYGGYICMTKRMSAEDLIKFLLYQSQINR